MTIYDAMKLLERLKSGEAGTPDRSIIIEALEALGEHLPRFHCSYCNVPIALHEKHFCHAFPSGILLTPGPPGAEAEKPEPRHGWFRSLRSLWR